MILPKPLYIVKCTKALCALTVIQGFFQLLNCLFLPVLESLQYFFPNTCPSVIVYLGYDSFYICSKEHFITVPVLLLAGTSFYWSLAS